MEKKRMKEFWETLVQSYRDTVEYKPYGTTGDPRKTIALAKERGVSVNELVVVLAVIAKMKDWDERISRGNRNWLYSFLNFDSDNWYMEYIRVFRNTDEIHSAHLNNLVSTIREEQNG